MATITVTKSLIGTEDISFESAGGSADVTFTRTKAGGGTQSITKIGASHINIRDTGSIITATTVEGALAEIAGDVDNVNVVFANGKGADIASAATAVIPSRHLYFDVTGTTNISAITVDSGGAAGRLVVLQFDSSLVVRDGSLRMGRDITTETGDHLSFLYDGSQWWLVGYERTVPTLHEGPFFGTDVDRLGPVQVTNTFSDTIYGRGTPLNGFLGGQTEFI
jgi:hypothetical protein